MLFLGGSLLERNRIRFLPAFLISQLALTASPREKQNKEENLFYPQGLWIVERIPVDNRYVKILPKCPVDRLDLSTTILWIKSR